jgi:two-component system, OmpR family, response regulator
VPPDEAGAGCTAAVPRILVIEDDERIASTVRRGLEHAGYRVEVCLDGAQGLRLALGGGYDLLVLDLLLPGLGGLEICGRLRAAGHRVPVLVLTARDTEDVEAAAYDAGADAFVTKPFSFPSLVAGVEALLRPARGSAVEDQEPVVTGLRLDAAAHRCWRGEAELALTPREFSLLAYLVRRAGEVASTREILDSVWDRDYDGDPDIVEVYVDRLRRKIDEPFGGHALETVRGAGFRLCVP